jgi:hypothetical protein
VSNLILGEVTRNVVRLQMAHAAMTPCVHTARRDAKPFANRLQHLPHDIVIRQWRSCPCLENAARSSPTKMFFEHLNRA